MTILTLLQIITIIISIATIFVNYIFSSKEKKKNNLAAISATRSIEILNDMRDIVADIWTLCSVDVLKDIKNSESIDTRLYPNAMMDLAVADGKFKGVVFPFKEQEADLLIKEGKIVSLAQEFYNNYDKNDNDKTLHLEKELKNLYQEFFIAYSLYDWACWESIMEQVSGDKYTSYTFDKFYDEVYEKSGLSIFDDKTTKINKEKHKIKTKDIKVVNHLTKK